MGLLEEGKIDENLFQWFSLFKQTCINQIKNYYANEVGQ